MSGPERKTVSLEDRACTAKRADDEAIDESMTVTTFGYVFSFNASGETIVFQSGRYRSEMNNTYANSCRVKRTHSIGPRKLSVIP